MKVLLWRDRLALALALFNIVVASAEANGSRIQAREAQGTFIAAPVRIGIHPDKFYGYGPCRWTALQKGIERNALAWFGYYRVETVEVGGDWASDTFTTKTKRTLPRAIAKLNVFSIANTISGRLSVVGEMNSPYDLSRIRVYWIDYKVGGSNTVGGSNPNVRSLVFPELISRLLKSAIGDNYGMRGSFGTFRDFGSLLPYFPENVKVQQPKPKSGRYGGDFQQCFKPWSPLAATFGLVVFGYGYWKIKYSVDGDLVWPYFLLFTYGIVVFAYSCNVYLEA